MEEILKGVGAVGDDLLVVLLGMAQLIQRLAYVEHVANAGIEEHVELFFVRLQFAIGACLDGTAAWDRVGPIAA